MEQGLPQEVRISLREKNGVVYDLVTHKQLATKRVGGRTIVNFTLRGAWGALLAIYKKPIHHISIQVPAQVVVGEREVFTLRVVDDKNQVMPGVQPLKVTILDPKGQISAFSNYYATTHGKCEVGFTPAENDLRGTWKITVEELSSGQKATKKFSYK